MTYGTFYNGRGWKNESGILSSCKARFVFQLMTLMRKFYMDRPTRRKKMAMYIGLKTEKSTLVEYSQIQNNLTKFDIVKCSTKLKNSETVIEDCAE